MECALVLRKESREEYRSPKRPKSHPEIGKQLCMATGTIRIPNMNNHFFMTSDLYQMVGQKARIEFLSILISGLSNLSVV
jgi:hypothetical protein